MAVLCIVWIYWLGCTIIFKVVCIYDNNCIGTGVKLYLWNMKYREYYREILSEGLKDVVRSYVDGSRYDILSGWGSCAFYANDFVNVIRGSKVAYMPFANPANESYEDHIVPIVSGVIVDFAKVPGKGVSKEDRSGIPPVYNPGYEEINWPRLTVLNHSAFERDGVYGKLGYIRNERYDDWEYQEFGDQLNSGKYPVILDYIPNFSKSSIEKPPMKR